MPDSHEMIDALDARVARRDGRRAFFTAALGAAAVGAGAFAFSDPAKAQAVTDFDILNFALNLEYLEANFYYYAFLGIPIPDNRTTGTGTRGQATGGRRVNFTDPIVASYAQEIAADEFAHVDALRTLLGSNAVAQPAIDVGVGPNNAFSKAAQAAGLISANQGFDVYASDETFLLGAFIFEDVGVTAYKGAAPLITNKAYLEAAAGILAVEGYHASIVRTTLYRKGINARALATPPALDVINATEAISGARDRVDGASDLDQGIAPLPNRNTGVGGAESNIVPLDADGLAFSRTTGQVLNIVYLNNAAVTAGGFFPNGMNGNIKTSAAN